MPALVDGPVCSEALYRGSSTPQTAVTATLSYVHRGNTRPRSYAYAPPPGVPAESANYDMRQVPIHDARAASTPPSLEHDGFELWDAPTAVHDFTDERSIRDVYYEEAAELALQATGGRRAHVFDHLVRRRNPADSSLAFGRRGADGSAAANGRVHNDYTEDSGRRRLALVVTEPSELAEVHRYSIVNIWRPIRGPVLDAPLTLCDARSLVLADLMACDVMYPNRTGEIYVASHSANHRWAYFPQMERHEAIVFKQYDSQVSGTTRFTPHTAFIHPETPKDAEPRQSIELRCLVTY